MVLMVLVVHTLHILHVLHMVHIVNIEIIHLGSFLGIARVYLGFLEGMTDQHRNLDILNMEQKKMRQGRSFQVDPNI